MNQSPVHSSIGVALGGSGV